MDGIGLNRKYHLSENGVVVKEAGLYYVYAQVIQNLSEYYMNKNFKTNYSF